MTNSNNMNLSSYFYDFDRLTMELKTILESHKTRSMFETYVVPFYTVAIVIYLFIRLRRQNQFQKSASTISDTTRRSVDDVISDDDNKVDSKLNKEKIDQPIDISGVWKLISNENVESFLEAQGVPWPLRQTANRARPTHRITHIGNNVTIRITAGLFDTQTKYMINGPKVTINVRGRIFEDSVSYLPNNTGVMVCKHAITEKYKVYVSRTLSPDKQQLTLTSTVDFSESGDESKESVTGIQIFRRAK